tara:strand:- start:48291 stop:51482 length:3192 start_codon:yes stop_codon:yes gene_type:complete
MPSGKAIENGDKAYEDEDYEAALKQFNKVHPGDTNYHSARYEIALTYYAMEEYDKTIGIATEEIELGGLNTAEFYNLLGTTYDKMSDNEKALETYTMGIKKYPAYYRYLYNRALTYEKMEKYDQMVADLKSALKLNPFHANSHYMLAKLAKEEGQYTMAMLSYNTYLLIKPKDNLSFLSEYNEFLKGDYVAEPKGIKLSDEDYSDIDEMIIAQIALSKKYKVPNKIQLAIVKQNYLMVQQLQQRTLGKGFWDTFYVPFYVEIMNDGQFDAYLYFSLQSTTNKSIIATIKKNIKSMQAFPQYAGTAWQQMHSDFEEEYAGKKQMVHYYWSKRAKLQGKGVIVENEPVGIFHYYYNVGALSAKGNYSEDGERTGVWEYYYISGATKEKEVYDDGDLDGNDSSFFENGVPKSITIYSEGKATGKSTTYNNTGIVANIATYEEGKLNGETRYFYDIGAIQYIVNYTDEVLTGDFKEFYPNGKLSQKAQFEAGKRTGLAVEYYNTGQKSDELNYVDGTLEGKRLAWYPDGTLKREQEYKDGVAVNSYKEYNQNGSLKSEKNLDENGKRNGEYKEYDLQGNLNLVLYYKKGDLVAYKVYHRDGSLIKEAKKKGGEFLFENFYSDGTIKAVGNYLPGEVGQNGLWKFYTSNGVLSSTSNYAEGSLNGTTTSYYDSGQKKSVTNYKDGKSNGYYVSYFQHGGIEEQGYYVDGKLEGVWLTYESDGTLARESFYTKGKRTGPQTYYAIDGKLDEIDVYEDGVNKSFEIFDTLGNSVAYTKFTPDSTQFTATYFTGEKSRVMTKKGYIFHGPDLRYYANGQKSGEGMYWNGSKHGKWTTYFVNGQINSQGEYYYGDKIGDWVYYYEDGQIVLTESYKDGNIHGLRTWYHPNGKKDSERMYENGEVHGLGYYYDGNGVLQQIRTYFYGKIVGYAYLGADNKPVPMIPITNETCSCKSYFANGNVSREYTMTNGSFSGDYLEYYENGKLFSKSPYENQELNGTKYTYWDNGQVWVESPEKNGDTYGTKKFYDKDGNLTKTEDYVLDNKHGWVKTYDKSGKVLTADKYYDGTLIIK